jgi:hypothetical protein
MEPTFGLPLPQAPSASAYPEPDQFIPHHPTPFLYPYYKSLLSSIIPAIASTELRMHTSAEVSTKFNSVIWVHERTIQTQKSPLVGEISANFLLIERTAWSAQRIPTAVFSVFYTRAATYSSK